MLILIGLGGEFFWLLACRSMVVLGTPSPARYKSETIESGSPAPASGFVLQRSLGPARSAPETTNPTALDVRTARKVAALRARRQGRAVSHSTASDQDKTASSTPRPRVLFAAFVR
jgi:hypothetical protein